MTNEERAITDKRDEIVRAAGDGRYQDADDILSAYADEIRRECVTLGINYFNKAVSNLKYFEGMNWYDEDFRAAIMRKEVGK